MPTTVSGSQVENLRLHADRNVMVLAGRDGFKVSKNNAFNRLIVWIRSKLTPASHDRQVNTVRERFIAAIGNRYGAESGTAAREALASGHGKPLKSREIKQVFARLDQIEAKSLADAIAEPARVPTGVADSGNRRGADSPAPSTPKPAAAGMSTPQESTLAQGPTSDRTARSPAFHMQVDPHATQRAVNGHSPDPLPAGGLFYRELQDGGSGMCGMHALNAFCGGPVIGTDEYARRNIEVTLDIMGVQGQERDSVRKLLSQDFSTDPGIFKKLVADLVSSGRLGPSCAHVSVETGLTTSASAAESPQAHEEMRARINSFPGDRLMVGFSRGAPGSAHWIALRRERDGGWQVLDSLKASTVPPKRADNLADCLDKFPGGVQIVHVEPDFSFRDGAAEPESFDDLPEPAFDFDDLERKAEQEQSSEPESFDDLPEPAFDFDDFERKAEQEQPAAPALFDDQPEPASTADDLARMAGQEWAAAPANPMRRTRAGRREPDRR